MKNNKKISSLAIGMGFPLTQMTLLLYTAVLSVIGHTLGATTQQMLFSLSIVLAGYTIGNLFWGTWSDHIGRRNALLIGLIGYLVL